MSNWIFSLMGEAPPPEPAVITATPLTDVVLIILLWIFVAALFAAALVLTNEGE